MIHQPAIVSGSDDTYFALLRGLVRSLRDKPEGRDLPLYILDAGLSAPSRAWLEAHGAVIATPAWPHRRAVPGFIAMLAARPRIPDYFPGHETYMWIDADAWMQHAAALTAYGEGARAKGFCITPEYHPLYNNRELAAAHRRIRSWFGDDVVTALEGTKPVNAGVFAATAGAPHWGAWERRVDDWLGRSEREETDFNADQTALNMVLHADGLPATLLPARFNWLCHTAPPMTDEAGAALLVPEAPYDPLVMVHMTVWTKRGPQTLRTLGGDTLSRPLTYGAEPLPEDGGALPDFALKDL